MGVVCTTLSKTLTACFASVGLLAGVTPNVVFQAIFALERFAALSIVAHIGPVHSICVADVFIAAACVTYSTSSGNLLRACVWCDGSDWSG